MPREHPHAGTLLCPLHLPEPNDSIEAPTGEQAPIGTPGHRVHRAAIASERLQIRARLGVPKPDGGIYPAAGENLSIGGKREALDAVELPARPEQRATLQLPQLHETIPAPNGHGSSIPAETHGRNRFRMRPPAQLQQLSLLPTHTPFPSPSHRRPMS